MPASREAQQREETLQQTAAWQNKKTLHGHAYLLEISTSSQTLNTEVCKKGRKTTEYAFLPLQIS